MKSKLIVNVSPHLHKDESVSKIMWMVVISLIPAGVAGVLIFGLDALWVILLGIVSALITEWIIQLLTKRRVTILDGSAFLTGLLLAYNLPAKVPFWLPVVGSFFAIAIGKQVFGGLGQNIFNPALVGRVFLVASWPKYMTTFTPPQNFDAITSATPLAIIKEGRILEKISYLNLFFGNRGGCIGEVCIFALVLGALFLFIRGYISWHIPITYTVVVGLFTYIFGQKGLFTPPLRAGAGFGGDWLLHILSGGLILGAFFMATDYVTSPLTRCGQIIFGIGCGLITAIIRLWGGYPEGVSYAILMMNAATPIIDRYTKNRIYGTKI
ncbi:MAG: Na+-transporting NADH:ubiquinone oxidoreductase subunit D [Candidatus Omnitrophica bacterium CG23_combo_of_CG06-09_8_20_14_all_40_11]|nr:MAG: Na+-transporting NADH:ubiquinone oxidoreductase subunit D [Candidatus Omnitrophica bacterium CG23_combo_of_CG06-09_8_20_14_all_40_11]